MSFIQDVNNKINAGYDIIEFHLLYSASNEKFSSVYGKKCTLSLDAMNALKFWEETTSHILGMLNSMGDEEHIEEHFNNYKQFIYRYDYNTESVADLWEIVNVLIAYAPYDADHNEEDLCRVTLKKKDQIEVVTYQNNKKMEETLN